MISQTVPPLSASLTLPTMYDLPSENPEEPLMIMTPETVPPLSALETSPMIYDLPSENAQEADYADDFHFLEPILLFLAFLPANWRRELV